MSSLLEISTEPAGRGDPPSSVTVPLIFPVSLWAYDTLKAAVRIKAKKTRKFAPLFITSCLLPLISGTAAVYDQSGSGYKG